MPSALPTDRRRVRYVEVVDLERDLLRVRAKKSRRSLAWFARYSWHVLESGPLELTPFIQAQCDTLQAFGEGWLVANGKGTPEMVERQRGYWAAHGLDFDDHRLELLVQDLIVTGFPGSLKSRIAMVLFPAWMWLHDPTFTIAATSGTGDNVSRDSNLMRELVCSPWYVETFDITWQVGINRAGDVIDSVGEWHNSAGGYRLSKELFSSWQGVHVDYIPIDDPDDALKVWGEPDRVKTRSKCRLIRNRVRHPTRSIRLLVQQRVHVEDVTGSTIANGTWSAANDNDRTLPALLSIPLQFRPDRRRTTPWGWTDPRVANDEVADPRRYPPSFIASEKRAMGSSAFEGQYNGNPEHVDGGWYKRAWWRWLTLPETQSDPRPRPDGCKPRSGDGADPAFPLERRADGSLDVDVVALSVDATFGALGETASAVALTVLARQLGRSFVLHDDTEPREYTDAEAAIVRLVCEWDVEEVLVEAKAQGTAVVSRIKKLIEDEDPDHPAFVSKRTGRRLHPRLVLLEPDGGKPARGRACMPAVENGTVYILEGAGWVEPWVAEVSGFPLARRNDRFDSLTQFLNYYEHRQVDSPNVTLSLPTTFAWNR